MLNRSPSLNHARAPTPLQASMLRSWSIRRCRIFRNLQAVQQHLLQHAIRIFILFMGSWDSGRGCRGIPGVIHEQLPSNCIWFPSMEHVSCAGQLPKPHRSKKWTTRGKELGPRPATGASAKDLPAARRQYHSQMLTPQKVLLCQLRGLSRATSDVNLPIHEWP